MSQVRESVAAIRAAVDIQIACSLGMLTQEQVDELANWAYRYNHNLKTARSHFGKVVTTHSFDERIDTCQMVKAAGMELCCGGILGLGETLEQRAEFAAQLAELEPDEVPLNFLNPRPGTPFGDLPTVEAREALKAMAMFRLVLPRTILRYGGGARSRSATRPPRLHRRHQRRDRRQLPDDARPPGEQDLDTLADLKMPLKALSATL